MKKKKIPLEFLLDELADIRPWTRQMFGSTAVYVEEKIGSFSGEPYWIRLLT